MSKEERCFENSMKSRCDSIDQHILEDGEIRFVWEKRGIVRERISTVVVVLTGEALDLNRTESPSVVACMLDVQLSWRI